MGHDKLVQNLNNRLYQDKICSTDKLIKVKQVILKVSIQKL